MRIMTNYLQILAVAMAFNLHFPSYMKNAFSGASQVGSSTGVLVSFDCLLLETRVVDIFNDISFFKVACIALLPVLLLTGSAIILRLIYLRNTQQYKRVI